MAAVTSVSLWLTLLSFVLFVSGGQINITSERGQTVSLPCKALNTEPVIIVDWSRTEPKPEEELLLYRDEKLVTFKNRADLQDRQMKVGNLSLILKNVTTDDGGTYECRVKTKTNQRRSICIIRLDVVSSEQINITAESGQSVSLPCKVLNNEPAIIVDWRRTEPKPEEELLSYRDEKLVTLKNRVDLQDRQMKDGNLSLILNNVTTDDSGTYECRVKSKTNEMTIIIRLDVVSSGHKKEGGDNNRSVGLIVGLIVGAAVVVAAVVVFLIFRRRRHPGPYHRPPDPDPDPDTKQL